MRQIRAAALGDVTPGAPHLVEADGTYPVRVDGDAVWVDLPDP